MNLKLITADGVDYAFKAVAIVFIVMWFLPPIPRLLGIDITASSVTVAIFLAAVGIARPHIEAWVFNARVQRAMKSAKHE